KTYNTRCALVVTDPTTNPALIGLSMGERTGSRAFQWVRSYVVVGIRNGAHHRRRRQHRDAVFRHNTTSTNLKENPQKNTNGV
ncbi:hypothetical protein BDP67DRAFT_408712, partial [Colletotrichum lupini]